MIHETAILMPVFNGQKAFEDTMAAIIPYSTDCEFVVVDDGSNPPLRVESFASGAKIHLIRLDVNVGIVGALNEGLRFILAHPFKYIARIDAGDTSMPARWEAQRRYLAQHPTCGLVGSDVRWSDEHGNVLFTIRPPRSPERLRNALRSRPWLAHSSVMYRASAIREIGLYSHSFPAAEDYDLYLRIVRRFDVGVIPMVLSEAVMFDKGISKQNSRRQAANRIKVQVAHFEYNRVGCYTGLAKGVAAYILPPACKAALKRAFIYRGPKLSAPKPESGQAI